MQPLGQLISLQSAAPEYPPRSGHRVGVGCRGIELLKPGPRNTRPPFIPHSRGMARTKLLEGLSLGTDRLVVTLELRPAHKAREESAGFRFAFGSSDQRSDGRHRAHQLYSGLPP